MDHTFYKVFHFDYFTHRNVNSQFKNNQIIFVKKEIKEDTRKPNSRPRRDIHL